MNVATARAAGRKFLALMIVTCLFLIVFGGVMLLALLEKPIPMSIGLALGALASCYPGYLGVNLIQKAIQKKEVTNG